MKRHETFPYPADEDDVYNLMFEAFQAGISVGLVPRPDEVLWDEWLNEEVGR